MFFGSWGGNSYARGSWFEEFGGLFHGQSLADLWVSCAAFMDDAYLFASSLADLQSMLNDLIQSLTSIGLVFNPLKVKWVSNKWAGEQPGLIRCCELNYILAD